MLSHGILNGTSIKGRSSFIISSRLFHRHLPVIEDWMNHLTQFNKRMVRLLKITNNETNVNVKNNIS